MEAVHRTLFGMKIKSAQLFLIAAAILFFAATKDRAQMATSGHGKLLGGSSVQYFDPPNQRQFKTRISYDEAQPLAGGLLAIKQLRLEDFDVDGKTNYIAEAPDCVYDTVNGTANSAGVLHMQSGDGKIRVEGEGFLWQQNAQSLTISNRVHTILEGTQENQFLP
jgi:hypothetical protein